MAGRRRRVPFLVISCLRRNEKPPGYVTGAGSWGQPPWSTGCVASNGTWFIQKCVDGMKSIWKASSLGGEGKEHLLELIVTFATVAGRVG